MKTESIKKLVEFWKGLWDTYEKIKAEDLMTLYCVKEYKLMYSGTDLYLLDFINELRDNAKTFSHEELYAYMMAYLPEVYSWRGFDRSQRADVIQKGTETAFCLEIMREIDLISKAIVNLMETDEVNGTYPGLEKLFEPIDYERLVLSTQKGEPEKQRSTTLNPDELNHNAPVDKSILKWDAPDTHLLELAKALYETGVVKRKDGEMLTQQEFFNLFGSFFNLELKNTAKKLNSATNRKKEQAPFLDKLKNAFESYCNRLLEN